MRMRCRRFDGSRHGPARRLAAAIAVLIAPIAGAAVTPPFTLEIGPRVIHGPLASTFVMPGDTVTLRARGGTDGDALLLETDGQGVIEAGTPPVWRWRAPAKPGLYPLIVHDRGADRQIRLNVFVKTPFDSDRAAIDGFRVAHYQPQARPGDPQSAPPAGLVRVTPANHATPVSPHFTLGQFLCHQQPDHWPKYVLIRPRLLDKLERIYAALADAGIAIDTLTVMSGFRTPWYNADIGNTTVYSQHLFGSAADIFVDADGDGAMDDLDADGVVDIADARWLAERVESVTAEAPALAGGLSAYPANAHHGPFVHIDVRGVRARW